MHVLYGFLGGVIVGIGLGFGYRGKEVRALQNALKFYQWSKEKL